MWLKPNLSGKVTELGMREYEKLPAKRKKKITFITLAITVFLLFVRVISCMT